MNEQRTNETASGPVSDLTGLLCCPFCGKAPIFPDAKDVFGTCYEAGCEECGIPSVSIQIIDCFDYPRDHVHDSWDNETMQYGLEYIEVARQEAIERWNTRAWHNVKVRGAPLKEAKRSH